MSAPHRHATDDVIAPQVVERIEPPEWLPLGHALRQRSDCLGSSKLAALDLLAWLRDGQLPSAIRLINSSGRQVCALLLAKFWQQGTLSDVSDDADFTRLHCRDPVPSDWVGYFFVRADVFERLTTSASASAPSKDLRSAPLRQRPGPPTTHHWFAIWSEILRHCLIGLPKSENKLAEKVAVWYELKYGRSVSVTEVRAAVKAICATLKKIQSRSKTSQR